VYYKIVHICLVSSATERRTLNLDVGGLTPPQGTIYYFMQGQPVVNNKLIDCPECGGTGQQMHAVGYPNGYREIWVDCEFCEGHGNFPEDEYIMLKLEGRV
jgi:hypothetical protein